MAANDECIETNATRIWCMSMGYMQILQYLQRLLEMNLKANRIFILFYKILSS